MLLSIFYIPPTPIFDASDRGVFTLIDTQAIVSKHFVRVTGVTLNFLKRVYRMSEILCKAMV